MIKKIVKLMFGALMVMAVSSCASTEVEEPVEPPKPEPKPVVIEKPAAKDKVTTLTKHFGDMLWEIKGADKDGNDSNIYLFGTISAADNRIYPVADNVVSALNHSDRVYSELSLADFNNSKKSNLDNDDGILDYSDTDKNTFSILTAEECQWMLDNMGLGILSYSVVEPWVFYDSLVDFQMKKTGLSSDKENKTYFYDKSASLGKPVEAIETLESNKSLDVYGNRDDQMNLVKGFIDEHIENPDVSANLVKKLYQSYVVGDDVTFTETLNKITKNNPGIVEYKNNNVMANKIVQILNEGGTSFIFADITRLVGDNSVFDILRSNEIIK